MDVFFEEGDYKAYLELLREWSEKAGTAVWGYCLMPNHVHLILVPSTEDGLRGALGETHRRYTRRVNLREDWRGHLWQERFQSFPVAESHLLACARYVELSPVRAKLVKRPQDWPWSSARAHLDGVDDGGAADGGLTVLEPLLALAPDWRGLLEGGLEESALDEIRRHVRGGHPLGSDDYYTKLQNMLGRDVRLRPRGRPKSTA